MAEIAWQEAAEKTERSTEDIQQHIEEMEEEITETVEEISDRIQEKVHWRTYVVQNPLLAVGVAAGLGYLASWLLPGPAAGPAAREEAPVSAAEDLSQRHSGPSRGEAQSSFWPSLEYLAFMVAVALAQKAASEFVFGPGTGLSAPPQTGSSRQPETTGEQATAG